MLHLDFPDLDLEGGQVLKDLQVVRLVLQGVQIALDGLGVVALGAVQESVHVPADMTVVGGGGGGGGDCYYCCCCGCCCRCCCVGSGVTARGLLLWVLVLLLEAIVVAIGICGQFGYCCCCCCFCWQT